MISHKYKCIFVHIHRCAGSSVEHWITGDDWWNQEKSTKHLLASQARNLYSEYWDKYFKFSMVRDPFSRSISCVKYKQHFGLNIRPNGGIDFSGYRANFGHDVTLEYDHRFHRREDVLNVNHRSGQVYGNLLDEPLDFIAHFENLKEDMEYVRKEIGHPNSFRVHLERSKPPISSRFLTRSDCDNILSLYDNDFARFGYSRDYSNRLAPVATRPAAFCERHERGSTQVDDRWLQMGSAKLRGAGAILSQRYLGRVRRVVKLLGALGITRRGSQDFSDLRSG
jgi:hypothetical protein